MPSVDITMAATSPKADLLDELTRRIGCNFISNLPQRQPEIHQVLLRIAADEFTLKAWREAAAYICGINVPYKTVHQAREALLEATNTK